ncbi:16S rRNA (cytosine(1402)-N(4))-methyltransferase [Candidatus Nomurabacteria bacterium RIFCSPLOWO2_01_FULL_41_21]|uniref:Ribosomal RNA small subunit methyltransferase H n=2 Tax=Candidatus Nomuraibacteriota TaxID=1752729 RepID=A0A1F6V2F7_9BACT|nr:MAG: 16S rRNA (cytosine(1402)-N(4))-methyltransferase [Candidatus Nomurabacteria bacterium RIFCSPHIGHO2_01_FULL_40_20]OGI88654.1 MAG: 16S rRNA (cytosine(1402)-N(4))-methyltransferase [Candidatus Nomurabacteria bacterium RIFCSPLOWO2_01_FULL_41_21]
MSKEVKDTVSVHKSVLLNEVIQGLHLSDKSVVVDGTFGGGGHSSEICKRYPKAKIIAIDQDKHAWVSAKSKFKGIKCDISFFNINFRDLENVLVKEKLATVDAVLFDLGLSSDQLENSGRGFSFLKDEPLLMTMKENPSPEDLTARDIVNTWSEENIADIIYGYGEERFSRRISKAIVESRKKNKFETTFDLVGVVEASVPKVAKRGRIHPATKTFQALRIAVNDELNTLDIGLKKGFEILRVGGRMAVVSFHSLEDRIVKRFYKAKEEAGEANLINKKPIAASEGELKENPRARSAKLRIIEKI